jgi:hypothetical protein
VRASNGKLMSMSFPAGRFRFMKSSLCFQPVIVAVPAGFQEEQFDVCGGHSGRLAMSASAPLTLPALPARPTARYAAFIMRLSVMAITESNIISCDKVCSAALSTTETDVKRNS